MAFWNRTDSTPRPTPPAEQEKPTPAPAAAPVTPATQAADGTVLRPSLGADTSVTGKLSFTAPTRIDGQLKGEVRASELLLIGAQGSVEGTVHAKALILEGAVRGDILGTEWVEVHASARLIGSVAAHRIEVHKGARVQAHMKITPPPPTAESAKNAKG